MNANDTAKTASLSLNRSPYSAGTARLAADLEKLRTLTKAEEDSIRLPRVGSTSRTGGKDSGNV